MLLFHIYLSVLPCFRKPQINLLSSCKYIAKSSEGILAPPTLQPASNLFLCVVPILLLCLLIGIYILSLLNKTVIQGVAKSQLQIVILPRLLIVPVRFVLYK